MKIVIAPDSFKESLSAKEVASFIAKGIYKVFPNAEVKQVPLADGGEGTTEALVAATGGKTIKVKIHDPFMRKISSVVGLALDGKTAFVELAAASGLALLKKEERNPLKTTTYGTGELLLHAAETGCEAIIIGIGGSATNDGGVGLLEALGVRFVSRDGGEIGKGGENLFKIDQIDISRISDAVKKVKTIVACDVTNPLCGPNGASAVFGPQKGATPEMVKILDQNLLHYSKIIEKCVGKEIKNLPGAGAAGGVGAGLLAFLNAELKSGFDVIASAVNLEEKIKDADWIITGEGKMDEQTLMGKAPYGVLQLALKHQKPIIGIAGSLGTGLDNLYKAGFTSLFSIVDKPMLLEEAIANAGTLLENTSERIFKLLKV